MEQKVNKNRRMAIDADDLRLQLRTMKVTIKTLCSMSGSSETYIRNSIADGMMSHYLAAKLERTIPGLRIRFKGERDPAGKQSTPEKTKRPAKEKKWEKQENLIDRTIVLINDLYGLVSALEDLKTKKST